MSCNACVPVVESARITARSCTAINDERASTSEGSIALDLRIGDLQARMQASGDPAAQIVYGYIISTVFPSDADQTYEQRGSAPNWDGGLITLCTCKHYLRASKAPSQWPGQWIAGMTGYNRRFGHQQSLVCLYRVGEAYGSPAALVQALRESGRASVVDAKDASVHPLGDLMVPRVPSVPASAYDPDTYKTPCLSHAHRQSEDDEYWKNDIHYEGRSRQQPAMLVGDPEFSFRWTRPLIRRSEPQSFRRHRVWTLQDFLGRIEGMGF